MSPARTFSSSKEKATRNKYDKHVKFVLVSLYSYESFGIRILHSILKKNGFIVYTIFFKKLIFNSMRNPTKKETELLLDKLEELNPSVVGLSVRSPFFNVAKDLTNKIKEELNTIVIWGGTHPTICPEECIKYADVVCIGEGEEAILEFARKVETGNDTTKIRNLWFNQDSQIIKNDIRPLISDLNSLPFPDYVNSNKYYIDNGELGTGDPALVYTYGLMASRGCPFQCTYCINSTLKKMFKGKGPYVRRRNVKNVIKELVHAKNHSKDLRYIVFFDEVFVLDKRWLQEFLKEYKNKIDLPFKCALYPTTIKEDIVLMLREAGLTGVTMGIQSGSERMRHQIYKRFSPEEDIVNATKILKKHGIRGTYDIILDNPLETEKDLRETFNLLLKIPRPFDLALYSLVNFPKTELTKKLIDSDVLNKEGSVKALNQWRMTLNYPRSRRKTFWYSLIALTSKNFVPKILLKLFSKIKFFKAHPYLLVFMCEMSNVLKLLLVYFRLVIERKVKYSVLIGYIKNFKASRFRITQ